jgi:hypothetical protein
MRRPQFIFSVLLTSILLTGCRNPMMNPYYNLVDDINDTHIYFDNWYCPRLDISRAGKPDWCGPVNSKLSPGICYLGCYDRYDDDNLYPPAHPYTFPSYTMPAPKVWKPEVNNPGGAPTEIPTSLPPQAPTPIPPEPTLKDSE